MPMSQMIRSAAASVQGVQPARAAERRPQIVVPSTAETVQISELDAQLIYYLGKDSPAIPMGVFATGVILLSGLASFNNNTSKRSQQTFMRARLVSQGITIGLMMGSLAVQERAKYLGIQ
mmetsp:Transcript_17038/g.12092  ORF Transcript_17038/g.12092 Transcript_17038/m.12092 type:complete len:120 (-) Transcript_17038:104-463(-)